MKTLQDHATDRKVETLAKLYLESSPAEICDETISELCDWLMGEFQQLPLNLCFSDYSHYDSAEEVFADIEQDRLWVSTEAYDTSIGSSPFYGGVLSALHDYDHYRSHSDWTMEGEIAAYRATANRAPSLAIQKILYSQIVLRAATHIYLGHTPKPKVVFP
ncbi:hypothetical protein [Altericista sp. CCNU0014]|uniref:hypothetical protein n=1 Tax=Altericista sp. CCNU0014 TaxID=3082949 RepID=UPI00384F9C31